MPNSTPTYHGIGHTRTTTIRTFLLFGAVFLIAYLLIYEVDLQSTVGLFRNMRLSLISFDQNRSVATTTTVSSSTASSTTTHAFTSQASTTIDLMTSTQIDRTSASNLNRSANLSDGPKEAFVTFSNNHPSYLALLKVFLDSVHAFSTRPVIAFGIDVDLNIDLKQYPRVIKRRIAQSDCGPSVYFCKIHAIVSSNLDYGVLMETDDVVNYNVDLLFEVLHVWPYSLPISPRHPTDPENWSHLASSVNVSRRTTPYIHAHIIWTYRAIPFLKHVQSLLRQGYFQGANYDETAVNVMLWKYGANHTLCKYDPFFTYSDAYERWPNVTNCTEFCHTAFVTLHGCKDHETSAKLLTRLKANVGKPAIQLFGMGGMRHINDTNATCCYPDSKPSPIHPLLCEHR